MDATCDFQEEKKGREKPQVMHIRLRIYHFFFFPLIMVREQTPIQSGLFVCSWERARDGDSTYTFIRVKLRGFESCCQAFSKVDVRLSLC